MNRPKRNNSWNRFFAIGVLVILTGFLIAGTQAVQDTSTDTLADGTLITPTDAPSKVSIDAPSVTSSVETKSNVFDYDLYSLDFLDENYGWVVLWKYNVLGFHNTTSLLHTKDGGEQWTAYLSENCLIQKVSFEDSEHGYAIALEGYPELSDGNLLTYEILGTDNGGEDWKIQFTTKAVYGTSSIK